MHKLDGKVALVTGNSRGIGPYISRTLSREGVTIVGVARSAEGLERTEVDIRAQGGKCYSLPFDLTQLNDLPDLVERATSVAGEIDILINNAALESYKYYVNNDREDVSSILKLNLRVPMELSRLMLPTMQERGGHIVNVASLAGKKGIIFNSIYSASKSGLITWTDAMDQELRGTGVGISVICPGYVRGVGMFANSHLEAPRLLGTSSPQSVADAVLKAIKEEKSEIIVNPGPIKPLLALGQLISSSFAYKIVRWFGIVEMNKKRVAMQEKLERRDDG
ncbi:MAG: SDR family NAD(P)-dependent oxidoreductase [Candidatus Neomarinimicrobiota bacterium]